MPSANRDPGFYQRLSALALPIILQNLISTSLGFADTFMVGLLSSDALSAVAAANALSRTGSAGPGIVKLTIDVGKK